MKKGVCSVFLKITADILFGRFLTQVSLHYLIFVDFALIFSETNRPFLEVGHVLEYYLATAREMARHQMIHSYYEALSVIARSLPIIVIIIITLIVTSSRGFSGTIYNL